MDEINYVRSEISGTSFSGGNVPPHYTITTSGTNVDFSYPSLAVFEKLLYLSQSLESAYNAHLISGEHASAIYKKYLKEWGIDVPKKKGGE